MTRNARVYLIDDDEELRRATQQTLELAGFAVSAFAGSAAALIKLKVELPDVVVSDIRMSGLDGLQLFARMKEIDPDLPVILITGHGDIAMAVKAIQEGVYDFIPKPFAAERLTQSVHRAAEKRSLVLENRSLRQAADSAADMLPLIGQTPAMERLRQTLRHIADMEVDVLIAGETGTGKEVVATLLHQCSRRKKGNFVALNCGAFPETLIESELFGHEPGAHSTAQKKRIGHIEEADGGTLFLDEIESMPLATQVKILRVLQNREITPLGTNKARSVDLRVVAAAKIDLGDPQQRGAFREDLYYRLNVVTIAIPPLRERRADIPLLFSYFLVRAAARFQCGVPELPASVHRYLMSHPWPGNVRELLHYAERAVLGVLSVEPVVPAAAPADAGSLPERIERYEAALIRDALAAHKGDPAHTIETLGIPRKTFYDKLRRHGINRADYKETKDSN